MFTKAVQNPTMAVVKSNSLIETSYNLGSREQFFIILLISKLDSIHDTEFPRFEISYQNIARMLNFDGKRRIANRSDVFKIMDNLNSKSIRFEDDQVEEQVAWITQMKRDKKTDTFTFTFPNELKPYLIQLKEQFTKYNIQNIVNLNSHSVRIYEILKRYQYNGEVVLEIENQLKKWLGLEDKYPEYYEFKRWVLLDAQKQLKKFTDISFTFETARKEGRKIVALRFFISDNKPSAIPKSLEKLNSLPIGNIGGEERGKRFTPKENSNHQEKLSKLNKAQLRAYNFLAEKGVNKGFIVDSILRHGMVKYEPLKGFEDIYIRIVWNFFVKKTKSNNLAPTFVTWWKKGRLTENSLHAKHVEAVIAKRRGLKAEERNNRLTAKDMTHEEYKDVQKDKKVGEVDGNFFDRLGEQMAMSKVESKSKVVGIFEYANFKKEFPKVYFEFYEKERANFEQLCKDAGQDFDEKKYRKSIEDRVEDRCKHWWSNRGK